MSSPGEGPTQLALPLAAAVAAPTEVGAAGELTDQDRAMLDFERLWWRTPGSKEQAIHDRFDLSVTRYYQQLLTALRKPAALEYAPATVNRLRAVLDRAGASSPTRKGHR